MESTFEILEAFTCAINTVILFRSMCPLDEHPLEEKWRAAKL